jgi:hypothetical protein
MCVDDDALPLLAHLRDDGAAGRDHAERIRFEEFADRIVRGALDYGAEPDARIIHPDVNRTMGGDSGGDRVLNAPFVRYVERQHRQAIRAGCEHVRLGAPHRGDDVPSVLQEEVGRRLAVA